MKIISYPMGEYATNCYVVSLKDGDIIIDPGVDATQWVLSHIKKPVAILNTHGHFDHIWSNAQLKELLKIPLYCPKADAFMLNSVPFKKMVPPSTADIEIEPNSTITLANTKVKFLHFPGHSPGCSVIQIDDVWFSGDFIFENSIGRWDFKYSSQIDMLHSLKKALNVQGNFKIYPGHGPSTTFVKEKKSIPYWIDIVRSH